MAKSLLSAVLRHLGLRNSNWNLRNEDKRQIPRSSSRILIIKDGAPFSYFIGSTFSTLIGCRCVLRPYRKTIRPVRGLCCCLPRPG